MLAQLPPRRDFRYSFWKRIVLRQSPGSGACIHGHFDYTRGTGIQQYYPNIDQYITVLRDPFEIAVSDYFFAKSHGDNWFINGRRAPIAERYRGFDDYFEREVLHRDTFMVNYLPVEVTLSDFARVFESKFIYVGVAEDLPTTVRLLADKLGFPNVDVPHSNKSPRDEPISPGLREAFFQTHPVEYALYQYALAHYKD